jgi:hypothetical protein
MPFYCLFDLLSVELLHALFTYFLAHEILLSFSDVSDYVNAVLLSYSTHRLDFKSIQKTHFDLVCRHIQPKQVILLTLSDDYDTPGQSELFFSRFRIEEFTQLRSFTLFKIEFESVVFILSNLYKLKNLRSFSFDVHTVQYKYSTENIDHSNESTNLNSLLQSTYDQLPPLLNRLCLNNLTVLTPATFQRLQYLRHLKLVTSSLINLHRIFDYIPQLQSFDVRLNMSTSNFISTLPFNQLIRVNLIIDSEYEKHLKNV